MANTMFTRSYKLSRPSEFKSPGALLVPSHDQIDDKFALSTEDLYTLQVYVEEANKIALKYVEPIQGPEGEIKFDALNARNKLIGEHAKHWNTTVFPSTVSVAGSIKTYCDYVETYYQGLLDKASKGDQQGVVSTLNYLGKKANAQLDLANKVHKSLVEFRALLIEDKDALTVIHKDLDTQFNANSEYRKKLEGEIAEAIKNKDDANKRYNQACVNAATSPTYAWVLPPLGLIAAGVVSGIFGAQAVQAKKDAEYWAGEAEKKTKLLGLADNVINTTNVLLDQMDKMGKTITNALTVVGKICGIWEAIKSDMTALSQGLATAEQSVKEDLDYLYAIFDMDLNALRAIWKRLGVACLSYELTAYVTVK